MVSSLDKSCHSVPVLVSTLFKVKFKGKNGKLDVGRERGREGGRDLRD